MKTIVFIFISLIIGVFGLTIGRQRNKLNQNQSFDPTDKLNPMNLTSPLTTQHRYYSIQQTNRISSSRSVKFLSQCKDLCLSMHKIFPFEFKYHRLIYRQEEGIMKYIIGECFYRFKESNNPIERKVVEKENMKNSIAKTKKILPNQTFHEKTYSQDLSKQKWYAWSDLKQFIDMPFIDDEQSKEQKKTWQSYHRDCEDTALKLQQGSRLDFKFTVVHSNFQYYQNQGFKNLQPFDDIGELLSSMVPPN